MSAMFDRPPEAITGMLKAWASLPSYWSSLVGTVRAINTATTLPAC